MSCALLVLLLAADVTDSQMVVLKRFRSEFLLITPGEGKFPSEILMGRTVGGQRHERPAHRVKLTQKFWIAKYEVPQNLWQAVMGSNPSKWKGDRNSAEMFNWDEAQQFCAKATELMRAAKLIDQDQVIRLPSEVEWEYVARAGTTSVYSFGEDATRLDEFGWHTGNASGNDPPVGAKKPNAWGLYDIHGYLWEWCADVWHESYQGAPKDASVWTKDGTREKRVLRGGSWKDPAEKLTSSFRLGADKSLQDDAVGLRCVLSGTVSK